MAPDILGNIARLEKERNAEPQRDGTSQKQLRTERVKEVVDDPEKWKAFLYTMAEQPGRSARNLAAFAELRATDDRIPDPFAYLELLTYEDASKPYRVFSEDGSSFAEKQGGVKRGQKAAVTTYEPVEDGKWKTVSYFLPSQCYDLNEKRFIGRPMKASSSERNLKAIAEAMGFLTDDDVEKLDPIVETALELRYGLNRPEDELVPAPAYDTVEDLIATLNGLSHELSELTRKIDKNLAEHRRGVRVAEPVMELAEEDIPFELAGEQASGSSRIYPGFGADAQPLVQEQLDAPKQAKAAPRI